MHANAPIMCTKRADLAPDGDLAWGCSFQPMTEMRSVRSVDP
jgi:hypothetical protein